MTNSTYCIALIKFWIATKPVLFFAGVLVGVALVAGAIYFWKRNNITGGKP